MAAISFHEAGARTYCQQLDGHVDQQGSDQDKGRPEFERLVDEIKAADRGSKYDFSFATLVVTSNYRLAH